MTANFNMNFDPTIKQQFADVLADYGLTVPQAFKLFANQVIKTQSVPLSFDWRNSKPTELALGEKTIASLKQGSADYLAGKLDSYPADMAITAIQELARD